jgi:hypothetical protein
MLRRRAAWAVFDTPASVNLFIAGLRKPRVDRGQDVTAADVIDCIESVLEDVEAQSVSALLVNVSGKSRTSPMFLAVFV